MESAGKETSVVLGVDVPKADRLQAYRAPSPQRRNKDQYEGEMIANAINIRS